MAKNNRKLDKKYKEAVLQAEEERRHADQYKEQVCVIVTFFLIFIRLRNRSIKDLSSVLFWTCRELCEVFRSKLLWWNIFQLYCLLRRRLISALRVKGFFFCNML